MFKLVAGADVDIGRDRRVEITDLKITGLRIACLRVVPRLREVAAHNSAWDSICFYIRAALPQIRVETLIGAKIIISYEKYSPLNINTKVSKNSNLPLFRLTSIREVAALSSPTRIAYTLNKETF